MSSGWSWFVILGTVISLIGVTWLLLGNRNSGDESSTTGHEWDGIEELDTPLPMWWVWGFLATIVFAVGYLIYYPGLGNIDGIGSWTSTGQHDEAVAAHEARFEPLYNRLLELSAAELQEDATARQIGRRLYLNHCATCHGITGKGSFGFPDLTDDEWIWGEGFEQVKTAIRQGRNAQMPPWGPALGEQGVAEVTQTVLRIAGLPHDADAAAAGEARYQMMCVACHGADGKGNALLGAPDLTNDLWLYGREPEQIAFTIRHGRNGVMPAHSDLLSEAKIHTLAAFVEGLSE